MNAFCGERGWGVSCLFVKSGSYSEEQQKTQSPCARRYPFLKGTDGRLWRGVWNGDERE